MRITHRPRRQRRNQTIRDMFDETQLSLKNFVYPLFVSAGKDKQEPIESLPGQYRWSPDLLLKRIKKWNDLGIKSFALFPHLEKSLKDSQGSQALNKQLYIYKLIEEIKQKFPEVVLISDVALDPFTSHGHDGLVKNGKILNDETIEVLAEMAILQAQAGVDYVAPSDMMDGRIKAIRSALDDHNLTETGIISYTAKYASAFYGPFRDAVGAKLEFGDKKTYQMNPANRKEALLEAQLDVKEGADVIMVKPALAYLDIISDFKKTMKVPIAAYNVSGEYSMIKAAASKGWIDEKSAILETLVAIRRAGADLIFSYHCEDLAQFTRTL